MFHLVMGNGELNQRNNQNRLGQQSEATQNRRTHWMGSEDPSALPGRTAILSGPVSFIDKNKGIGLRAFPILKFTASISKMTCTF